MVPKLNNLLNLTEFHTYLLLRFIYSSLKTAEQLSTAEGSTAEASVGPYVEGDIAIVAN